MVYWIVNSINLSSTHSKRVYQKSRHLSHSFKTPKSRQLIRTVWAVIRTTFDAELTLIGYNATSNHLLYCSLSHQPNIYFQSCDIFRSTIVPNRREN